MTVTWPFLYSFQSMIMNNQQARHYYIFTGNLYNRLLEIIDTLNETGHPDFEIWEPHDKTKGIKLLVINGEPLSANFCLDHRIWETSENVFNSFYSTHVESYDIHPRFFYCSN